MVGAEDRKPYDGNLYLAFGKAHTEEAIINSRLTTINPEYMRRLSERESTQGQ